MIAQSNFLSSPYLRFDWHEELCASDKFFLTATPPRHINRNLRQFLMFGPFRGTAARLGGYVWKIPYKMSRHQKARQRSRLRAVDRTIETVESALAAQGKSLHKLETLKELPKESEMPPRDKYWIFNKTSQNYRKGAHRQPHFTKVTNRVPPKGF